MRMAWGISMGHAPVSRSIGSTEVKDQSFDVSLRWSDYKAQLMAKTLEKIVRSSFRNLYAKFKFAL